MGSVGRISGFIDIKGFTRLPKLSLSQRLLIPHLSSPFVFTTHIMTEWSENAVWNDSGQELCGCMLSHETGNFGGIASLHGQVCYSRARETVQ